MPTENLTPPAAAAPAPGTPDDLVQVFVPRRHLSAVYALLAERDGGSPTTDGPPQPAAPPALPRSTGGAEAAAVEGALWSVADLQRFARTPQAMNVTLCRVLDVMAEDPGQYFATSDLEELTGIARTHLRGAFSALTRHLRAHYGGQGWMLSRIWGPLLDPQTPAEACYRLSAEQARRWREARTAR